MKSVAEMSPIEVTVKCLVRIDGGKRVCPWELKGSTIEEAAAMHRLHVEGAHP